MIHNCTVCSELLRVEDRVRRRYEVGSEFHEKIPYVHYEADFVSECNSNLLEDIVFFYLQLWFVIFVLSFRSSLPQ
jgi:hypothetical protein